jgi:predicted ATPase/DNA-binding SARP family transcriptional activator
MAQLRLFLLGSPYLMLDQQMVRPETRKAQALLIYLAVTGEHHHRDVLATLLWPDQDQGRARRSLRHALWLLKQAGIGDWLVTEGDSVSLRAGYWSDMDAFRVALRENALTEGVKLYRNDFLAGFTLRDCPEFDDWQFRQAEQLRTLLAGALETLVLDTMREGDYQSSLEYAYQWCALDPLYEPAHRALMKLSAQSGRYAAAIRQYQECVRLLHDELDIEPEPETQELYEAIRSRRFSTQPELPANHQTLTSIQERKTSRHNLLPLPTPFIGRKRELQDLDTLLTSSGTRLITILAAGGMGKTRLALAVAEQQLVRGQFADGIYFVPLASVRAGDDIIPAVAEALCVPLESNDRIASLEERFYDYVREKTLLLILDNCEHLLPEIDVFADMLQAAPHLRILATSRERLHLQDEQLYPIQGLDYPKHVAAYEPDNQSYAAVDLFIHSARRIRPDFAPTPEHRPYLARICQLVEGMPLGLELAAAWVNTLPLDEITAEIQANLDLLETDLRNIPTRQRSIRAIFDTTWRRLDATERDIFMQLSVFRGGFTREAVQIITGASLRVLTILSDKSLLRYDRVENRYQVHELLRQYVAGQLAQTRNTTVRDRHSTYYGRWLQEKTQQLKDARQETAVTAIETEIDNVQAAWTHAVEQRWIHVVKQMMDGLAYWYKWQGRMRNGHEAFQNAVNQLMFVSAEVQSPEGQIVLAKLLAWQGLFTQMLGAFDKAQNLLQRAQALLDSDTMGCEDTRAERAFVYEHLGIIAAAQGQDHTLMLYESSLGLFRDLEQDWEISEVLIHIGRWVHTLADFQIAENHYNESLTIKRTLGDQRGVATVLGRLSQIAAEQGQVDRAEYLARESSAIYYELGNRYGIVEGLRQLGVILMWQGKIEEARRLLEQSLTLGRDLGDRALIAQIHSLVGLASSLLGMARQSQEHAEIGLQMARDVGDSNQIAWCLWVKGWYLVSVEAHVDAIPVLQESIALFHQIATPTNEPRQLGWSLSLLGYAYLKLNDLVLAQRTLLEVLTLSVRWRDFLPAITALATAALIMVRYGQPVRAIELYALVWRYALPTNSSGWFAAAKCELEAVADSLPEEVAGTARAHGEAGDLHERAADTIEALNDLMHDASWPSSSFME